MKRTFGIAGAAALLAVSAGAQDANLDKTKAEMQNLDKMKAEIQMVLEKSKIAAGGGGVMGKTVKGAPYSGQEINESNQILADGTRIHNETRATVYRDGEGRVRRESGDTVTIWDPVAGVNYTLNPKNMTAFKTTMPPAIFMRQPMAGAMAGGGRGFGTGAGAGANANAVFTGEAGGSKVYVQDGMIVMTKDGKTEKFPVPADGNWTSDDGKIHLMARQTTDASGANHSTFTIHAGEITINENGKTTTMPLPAGGVGTAGEMVRVPLSADSPIGKALAEAKAGGRAAGLATKGESLGEETIEGVKSRGTRNVQTIEAGVIGNDRPLTTIAERWYSDELQTEILNKRTDPRTGESTFRLININRGEPGLYLFQVPSGYTLNERK